MALEEELYSVVITAREMGYIIIAIVVLIIVIIGLKLFERRLKKILKIHEESRNLYYRRKISELKSMNAPPNKVFDAINDTARNFFKEAFNLSLNLEYLELVEEFKKKKKLLCMSFCKMMSDLNYSGKIVDEYKIKDLLELLEQIINKNKIYSKEEEEIIKKLDKNTPKAEEGFFGKILGFFRKKSEEDEHIRLIQEKNEKRREKEILKSRESIADQLRPDLKKDIDSKEKKNKLRKSRASEEDIY